MLYTVVVRCLIAFFISLLIATKIRVSRNWKMEIAVAAFITLFFVTFWAATDYIN
jgi:ABC-type arginine/histidine transport system permease subunit